MEAVRGRYLGREKGHRHFGEKDGARAWHVLPCPWAASVSKTKKKATQPMEMKFHFLFTAHNLPGHLLFYIIGLKFAEPVVIPWSFLFKIVKFL